MIMRGCGTGALALLGMGVLAVASVASEARAEDVAAAKAHYEKGTALFDLQKYAEAAQEYEQAYQAKRDPAFLYNLGQAYRLARNPSKAIGAYRSYLRRMPNAPRKAEVEQRIVEMQKLEEELKRNPPPAEPTPAPAATPLPTASPAPAGMSTSTTVEKAGPSPADERASARRLKLAGIITGGIGLGILGAGIGLEVVAQQRLEDLNRPGAGAIFDPGAQSDMNTMHALGISFLVTGGVAVIAGATVFALGTKRGSAIVKKVLQ